MNQNEVNEKYRHLESSLQKTLEADPEIPDEDLFFSQLHNKIMAEVEKKPLPKRKRIPLPAGWPRWWIENKSRVGKLGSLGMLSLIAAFQVLRPGVESLATQELILKVQANPRLVAETALGSQQQDFLVDVASETLNHLDEEQVRALITNL